MAWSGYNAQNIGRTVATMRASMRDAIKWGMPTNFAADTAATAIPTIRCYASD